jgi:hypothetical protein
VKKRREKERTSIIYIYIYIYIYTMEMNRIDSLYREVRNEGEKVERLIRMRGTTEMDERKRKNEVSRLQKRILAIYAEIKKEQGGDEWEESREIIKDAKCVMFGSLEEIKDKRVRGEIIGEIIKELKKIEESEIIMEEEDEEKENVNKCK